MSISKLYNKAHTKSKDKKQDPFEIDLKKAKNMKPSMLGSPCYRKNYYSYNNFTAMKSIPLQNQRIMNFGTFIGDMIYNEMKQVAKVIDYVDKKGNIPIVRGQENPEFPISSPELFIKKGYIDITMITNEELWLVEVKSIGSRGFTGLKTPKIAHRVQAVLYLYIFNKMLSEGKFKHIKELQGIKKASGISILYYCKDNSQPRSFEITSDDDFFMQIIQKIQAVKAFSDAKQLPPKTPDYCNSCPYKQICDKDYNF